MEASVLMHCRLFQGLPEAKLPPLLEQLHSYRRSYEKVIRSIGSGIRPTRSASCCPAA